MKTKTVFLFSFILLCFLVSCPQPEGPTIPDTDWTVMIYSAGDRNLSSQLMGDLAEIKSGTNNNMTIIALADNTYNTQTSFSEAFSGTRLYQIYNNDARRLSGRDILPEITLDEECNLNTGDADTFRRFITFCKTYYPAKRYAVFVGGHGIGAVEEKFISRSQSLSVAEPQKAMAVDGTSSSDWMFTAELTDAFDYDEPIDLFVLDCCTMGFAEVAYQYRPGNDSFNTQYMVVSLPQQIGEGLFYDRIFSQVTPTMSPIEFGKLILQQQENIEKENCSSYWRYNYTEILSMALYDCTKIETLKNAIDETVPYLANQKSLMQNTAAKSCGYWKRSYSYLQSTFDYVFDIYDIFTRLSDVSDVLSAEARVRCADVARLADETVLASFLLKDPDASYQYPFEENRSGLAIFLPQADYLWRETLSYNAIDIVSSDPTMNGYGNFAWCSDGSIPSNNIADNWFELLDSWSDTTNDESGGLNCYQY